MPEAHSMLLLGVLCPYVERNIISIETKENMMVTEFMLAALNSNSQEVVVMHTEGLKQWAAEINVIKESHSLH